MNRELVDKWLEHCRVVGHKTQAEALEQGLKPNRRKYATYELSISGHVIYCGLPYCHWFESDNRR